MQTKKIVSAVLASFVVSAIPGAALAAPYILTNAPGDGSVMVGVDGYGAFGSALGANSSNALYDPVGAGLAAGTTFESYVSMRIGNAGTRTSLTSGSQATNPTVSGDSTSGTSSFSLGGLSFNLSQTLTPLVSGGSQTGSVLTQTYMISNAGNTGLSLELIRYLDGDLFFDGSLIDGGGRISLGGTEVLFETDSATGSATSTTFVGITGEGGIIPVSGRYEIDSFSGLRSRIADGTALDDSILNDSLDGDQFIDANLGYDVTLGLRNVFNLAAGGSDVYITRTIFGSGAPGSVVQVPEPGTLGLFALGLLGLGARRRRLS